MYHKVLTLITTATLYLAVFPTEAHAVIYGFGPVTANSTVNVNIGISQLSVDVTQYSASTIQFKFMNTGPLASSITDVYFDDNAHAIALPLSIVNGTGVKFSKGASPANLPGGNTIGFVNDVGFDSDSDAPTSKNGVNPGEWLIIRTAYEGTSNLNSVLAALSNQTLRIGIHVQSFANGGSESFVSKPPTPPAVPEPGMYMMLGTFLGIVVYLRRKGSGICDL